MSLQSRVRLSFYVFVSDECGRIFILGVAAYGFESSSLLRLLNETKFLRFKISWSIFVGVEGRLRVFVS